MSKYITKEFIHGEWRVETKFRQIVKAKGYNKSLVPNLVGIVRKDQTCDIGWEIRDTRENLVGFNSRHYDKSLNSLRYLKITKAIFNYLHVKDVDLQISDERSPYLKDVKYHIDNMLAAAPLNIKGETMDREYREKITNAGGKLFWEHIRPLLNEDVLNLIKNNFGDCKIEHYNSLVKDYRMYQLAEVAPILTICLLDKPEAFRRLDKPIKYQIEKLLEGGENYNKNGIKSIIYFVQSCRRNGYFMRQYDCSELIRLMKKMSAYDINRLRKIDTADEWKLLIYASLISTDLGTRVLLTPNNVREVKEKCGSLTVHQINDYFNQIYDYMRHLGGTNVPIPNVGLRRLYELQEEYHNNLYAGRQNLYQNRDENYYKEHGKIFEKPECRTYAELENGIKMIFLDSEYQLYVEGTTQRHCVHSYTNSACNGDCLIYSMRDKNDSILATIELDPNLNIMQALGKCNQRLDDERNKQIEELLKIIKKPMEVLT